MVGSHVLKLALASDQISKVIVYGRSSVDFEHEKMVEYLSPIFTQFPVDLLVEMGTVDHILFCLGVYTGAVKRELFREITVDYPVELARKHLEANPKGSFTLLSGQGADRSEKSRMMFAEDKGAAENLLSTMYAGTFYTLRPGYIYPVEKREEPNQQEIDLSADVIVAIDYYLECLERGTAFNLEFLIERALQHCSTLGFPYIEEQEETAASSNETDTEEELQEEDEETTHTVFTKYRIG